MGSYSQMTFADYPIFDNKNWYFQEIVNSIFLPDDFKKLRALHPWPLPLNIERESGQGLRA